MSNEPPRAARPAYPWASDATVIYSPTVVVTRDSQGRALPGKLRTTLSVVSVAAQDLRTGHQHVPDDACFDRALTREKCRSVLWAAAHHGHDAVVRLLLEAGADPNLVIEVNAIGRKIRVTPLAATIDAFLASNEGSWQLPIVARLLRAGASLDDCDDGRTAEDIIAKEEERWSELVENNDHFQAAKTLIRGVRAAGSWKKYCRARAPHREILALRSLAMRGYLTPYQKRRTRTTDWKAAVAFVARLGDNGIVWNILSFWRDADDIEDLTLGNGDVVRVYE